jgi:hypothetical protein
VLIRGGKASGRRGRRVEIKVKTDGLRAFGVGTEADLTRVAGDDKTVRTEQ